METGVEESLEDREKTNLGAPEENGMEIGVGESMENREETNMAY